MYCSQCGNEISQNSKYCSNCGSPVFEKDKSNFVQYEESPFDAVTDIQKKLREIDNRQKPPISKSVMINSALDLVKGDISALDSVFDDTFETQKLADKKQLILDYPLPTSPKALASFARYIYSEVTAKTKAPNALTDTWAEKSRQVQLFAESKFRATEEFAEIQKYHKATKRRERHAVIREYLWFLIVPILIAFGASLALHLPLLTFASILAAGWQIFLILYVYDMLDDMVESIKQHSSKQQNIPKWLRSIAWHLLVPALAALITAIVYHSVALIWVFGILFGVDAFFLLLFLGELYNW